MKAQGFEEFNKRMEESWKCRFSWKKQRQSKAGAEENIGLRRILEENRNSERLRGCEETEIGRKKRPL